MRKEFIRLKLLHRNILVSFSISRLKNRMWWMWCNGGLMEKNGKISSKRAIVFYWNLVHMFLAWWPSKSRVKHIPISSRSSFLIHAQIVFFKHFFFVCSIQLFKCFRWKVLKRFFCVDFFFHLVPGANLCLSDGKVLLVVLLKFPIRNNLFTFFARILPTQLHSKIDSLELKFTVLCKQWQKNKHEILLERTTIFFFFRPIFFGFVFFSILSSLKRKVSALVELTKRYALFHSTL